MKYSLTGLEEFIAFKQNSVFFKVGEVCFPQQNFLFIIIIVFSIVNKRSRSLLGRKPDGIEYIMFLIVRIACIIAFSRFKRGKMIVEDLLKKM